MRHLAWISYTCIHCGPVAQGMFKPWWTVLDNMKTNASFVKSACRRTWVSKVNSTLWSFFFHLTHHWFVWESCLGWDPWSNNLEWQFRPLVHNEKHLLKRCSYTAICWFWFWYWFPWPTAFQNWCLVVATFKVSNVAFSNSIAHFGWCFI